MRYLTCLTGKHENQSDFLQTVMNQGDQLGHKDGCTAALDDT